MARCTKRPIGPGLGETEAAALHAELDSLASSARAIEAAALRAAIAYTAAGTHKSRDGFSGIRDWITETFDFHRSIAGEIASIARLAPKFGALTAAATDGAARVDAVAYAVRRIEREGLAAQARTPFPGGPVASPYDPATGCATPEELIREYCTHAPFAELAAHLDRVCADLLDEQSLKDEASQQSLAWVEVTQRPDRMWDLAGRLTDATGQLLANVLKTAVPPPRQEDRDADGVLPAAANRNAEALHQALAAYGTNPAASKRHGHTATLSLSADVQVLKGEIDLAVNPERTPMLEGRSVSVSRARLLACEAAVVPMVFDYTKSEVVDLGREERLPNTALRRKLEAEQPEGCAWSGCTRPVAWCEAHHVRHWIDGGKTDAENLILLCRFHHGRIHTKHWEISKTGPGEATITHTPTGCTDADWDTDPACGTPGGRMGGAGLPLGLDTTEFAPAYRRELNAIAAEAEWQAALAAARDAKTKARQRYTNTEAPATGTHATTPGPRTEQTTAAPKPATTRTAATAPSYTATRSGSIAGEPAKPPALAGTHRATAPAPPPGRKDPGPPPF